MHCVAADPQVQLFHALPEVLHWLAPGAIVVGVAMHRVEELVYNVVGRDGV